MSSFKEEDITFIYAEEYFTVSSFFFSVSKIEYNKIAPADITLPTHRRGAVGSVIRYGRNMRADGLRFDGLALYDESELTAYRF